MDSSQSSPKVGVEYVNPLAEWTNQDKIYLREALEAFGSKNIKELSKAVKTKTCEEIKVAIEHYSNKALQRIAQQKGQVESEKTKELTEGTKDVPNEIQEDVSKKCEEKAGSQMECVEKLQKKTGRIKPKPDPKKMLDDWKKFLSNSVAPDDLVTESSTALKMIADLESFPPPVATYDFDFRNVYHQIADAMEGKCIPEDPMTTAIIRICLHETIDLCKELRKNGTYRIVLRSISKVDTEVRSFALPTKDKELAAFRHLISMSNYNPLHIGEEHLKCRMNSSYMEGNVFI